MKITHLHLRALLGTALMLVAAGCATVNSVEPANPESKPKMVNDKRIITDSTLNRIAYVEGVVEGTSPGGLKRVQVTLRNMTSNVASVSYQFNWVDDQGIVISSPTQQWQAVAIEGGQSVPIVSVAPTTTAKDFKLNLLESVGRASTVLPQ